MKNKGFTLIEILGVITLLALLSTIIILSVNKSLKKSKDTLTEIQINEIKSAATMWKTDNIELIPNTGYYPVSLEILQNEGYLKGEIINPKTSEIYDKELLISVGMNEIKIDDNYRTVYEHKGDYNFDGTNYINTNVYLFNNDNYNKNFQISLRIPNYNASTQVKQATFVSSMDETGSPYPGIVFRRLTDSLTTLQLVSNNETIPATNSSITYTENLIIKILRFNKKMYYSIDNHTYVQVKDYSNYSLTFSVPVTFGASLDSNKQPFRYYVGTLKDLKIILEK